MDKFTEKEVRQALYLLDNAAGIHPIDRRKLSRKIEAWGVSVGLCMHQCKHGHKSLEWHIWECPDSDGKKCLWRLYPNDQTWIRRFDAALDLPAEVLWSVLSGFLYRELPDGRRETKGFSLSNEKGWRQLDIYERGSRHATARDHVDKLKILCKLDAAKYIIFQYAGDVWQITDLTSNGESNAHQTNRRYQE